MIGNRERYPIPFKAEVAMPACAIMEANGTVTQNGIVCLKAKKYSTSTVHPVLLVNSPSNVAADTFGSASFATNGIIRAAGSVNSGLMCGPTNNSTTLSVNGSGFVSVGTANSNTCYVVHVMSSPCIIGKLNANLAQGSSANVSVWSGAGGSEADTNTDILCYDWLMKSGATAIASGKKVVCTYINGVPYVTGAECP